MEWIVVVVIIWLVSPIILGILTAVLSRKNRRQKVCSQRLMTSSS